MAGPYLQVHNTDHEHSDACEQQIFEDLVSRYLVPVMATMTGDG